MARAKITVGIIDKGESTEHYAVVVRANACEIHFDPLYARKTAKRVLNAADEVERLNAELRQKKLEAVDITSTTKGT